VSIAKLIIYGVIISPVYTKSKKKALFRVHERFGVHRLVYTEGFGVHRIRGAVYTRLVCVHKKACFVYTEGPFLTKIDQKRNELACFEKK